MSTRKEAVQGKRSRDVSGSTARGRRVPPPGSVPVWATKQLFYGGQRVRAGESFALEKPEDFSPKCMTKVDPEDGGEKADDVRAAEAAEAAKPTGERDVFSL